MSSINDISHSLNGCLALGVRLVINNTWDLKILLRMKLELNCQFHKNKF